MATTKPYLDMRGKAADGRGSVVILLRHNGTQTSIATGVRVSPSEWKDGSVIKNADSAQMNSTIQSKKSKIDKSIAVLALNEDFESLTASQIKEALAGKSKSVRVSYPLDELFDDYISSVNLRGKTKELYILTKKKINLFSPCEVLEKVDLAWLRRFDKYLSESQKINGRAIYLRCLRAVMNYARDNGIACAYPFSKFQIKTEETEKRSISLAMLRKFYTFPLAYPYTALYRDYFFLMFFLIGINAKDLLLAKKDQVRDGRLEYTRSKTGKKYSIKIEPEAQQIIDVHKGKGDYLLDAMDHCQNYTSFYREINQGLKLIGYRKDNPDGIETIEPLIPDITTYYARHTWATLAYEAGVPVDIISQALGHSMGNKTTLIYVKPDRTKVDEANRKVINLFFSTLPVSP